MFSLKAPFSLNYQVILINLYNEIVILLQSEKTFCHLPYLSKGTIIPVLEIADLFVCFLKNWGFLNLLFIRR